MLGEGKARRSSSTHLIMVKSLPLLSWLNRLDASWSNGLKTTSARPEEARPRFLARSIPSLDEVSMFTYCTCCLPSLSTLRFLRDKFNYQPQYHKQFLERPPYLQIFAISCIRSKSQMKAAAVGARLRRPPIADGNQKETRRTFLEHHSLYHLRCGEHARRKANLHPSDTAHHRYLLWHQRQAVWLGHICPRNLFASDVLIA